MEWIYEGTVCFPNIFGSRIGAIFSDVNTKMTNAMTSHIQKLNDQTKNPIDQR